LSIEKPNPSAYPGLIGQQGQPGDRGPQGQQGQQSVPGLSGGFESDYIQHTAERKNLLLLVASLHYIINRHMTQ